VDPTTGKPPYEEEPDDLQQMMEEDPYERAEEEKRQAQKAGPRSVYDTPEYREYTQRGTEIKQAMEDVPETLSFITSAPEGYFYRGQDVQEYNAKVREYNRQIHEYKRKLQDAYNQYRAGLITYDSYEVQRKSYEVQLKLYEAEMKRTAPQREAFLEYLESIGPPEPTEEQRRRMDAGMPITGIPGPALGPAPGSLGEWVQPIMQKAAEQTLDIMEAPFKAVTDPFRNVAAELGDKSIEAAMEAKPWLGFGYYVAGQAASIGAMGVDMATWEFRPGLWVDVTRTLTGLAVSPEARTAAADEILKDPFGFTAEMVGGMYLGGVLKKLPGKVYGEAELAYKTLKAQRGGTSEGLYGVSIKEPTWSEALGEWRAIKDVKYRETYAAKTTDIAEFKFLEEAGITEFPEEVVGIEPTYRTFEKRWLKFEGEGIKGEMPYYGAKDVRPPGAEPSAFDVPDDWIMKQITREADTALPYEYGEEGGFLRVRGGYGGMKPFAEPKLPEPPRAEALVVTAEAAPSTKILDLIGKPRLSLETELQFIPDIEVVMAQRPGFKFITPESIRPPSAAFKFLDISKAATLSLSKVKGFDKVFTVPTISLKQLEQQNQKQIEKPLELELPKMKQPQITGLTPTQIQTPTLDQIQKPRLEQIQIPALGLPQLTMPDISIPEEPTPIYPPDLPYFEPPGTPRRTIVKGDLLSPKKKKGKGRRLTIYELRVAFREPKLPDIADIEKTIFKEPKLLDFETGGKKKKKKTRKRR